MWYHHHDNYGTNGWGVLMLVFWLVMTVDLVLLGLWLWQKIQTKK